MAWLQCDWRGEGVVLTELSISASGSAGDNTENTCTALGWTGVYSNNLAAHKLVEVTVNVKQRARGAGGGRGGQGTSVRPSDGVTEPPRGATSDSRSLRRAGDKHGEDQLPLWKY